MIGSGIFDKKMEHCDDSEHCDGTVNNDNATMDHYDETMVIVMR